MAETGACRGTRERAANRPSRRQPAAVPRRDPNEIAAHVRNRDRSEIEAHLRNQNRSDRSASQGSREELRGARANARRGAGPLAGARRRAIRARRRSCRAARSAAAIGCAIILASLVTVVLVGAVLVPPFAGGFFRSLAEANPDLMRVGLISDAVASVMDDRPDKPARHGPNAWSNSSSQPGESSSEITQDLVNRGLVDGPARLHLRAGHRRWAEQPPGRHAHAQSDHVAARDRTRPPGPADDHGRHGSDRAARGPAHGAGRRLPADPATGQLRSAGVLRPRLVIRPMRSSRSSRG